MGTLGDLSPAASLAIGIVVGLISTSVQSLGLTLQRKSHLLEDEKSPHDVKRPPYRRRRWQLGMGMFIVSNVVGSSIQISTLPLPVLSTLQAAGLVFNSICASLILGEPFTRWSFWGTALVTSGAALIAIFGATPSPAHSLRELIALLGRWQFIVWMSLQAALVIAVAVAVELLTHFSTVSQSPNFRLGRGLAYGFISGTLSAHSLLFAKSAVELILRTIADGDNQFVHWQSWMLVATLVVLALSQLYYLHRGLKLVSTSVLYPLVFCIYNIIAIIDGLIYFKQTDLITPLHGGLIAVGTVILLAGVLALSWRLNDEQHQPAVGQSTLTPGLGLVDDTDGEETDSLLDSDTISDDGNVVPSTYSTFGPPSDNTPLTPNRKLANPWLERSEIWGELEDQRTASPPLNRRRSSTLPSGPANESTSLLPRRLVSGESAASVPDAPRRMFRKRRKSTGFPGFHARRSVRQTSTTSVQDALGGIWKMKWWRGGNNRPRVESTVSDTGAHVPWATESSTAAAARSPLHQPPPPGEGEWGSNEESGGSRPQPSRRPNDDMV